MTIFANDWLFFLGSKIYRPEEASWASIFIVSGLLVPFYLSVEKIFGFGRHQVTERPIRKILIFWRFLEKSAIKAFGRYLSREAKIAIIGHLKMESANIVRS